MLAWLSQSDEFADNAALLNRLITPSPHVLDKQVGRSDIGMHTRQVVPVQWARRPASRDGERPQVAPVPLLEKAAGFASGLEMRREPRAGSQTRRLPRVIGTPSKVRSERADLGISDSLVHLHTGVLTGLGRRLSTCQTVNSTSREGGTCETIGPHISRAQLLLITKCMELDMIRVRPRSGGAINPCTNAV